MRRRRPTRQRTCGSFLRIPRALRSVLRLRPAAAVVRAAAAAAAAAAAGLQGR